MLNERDHAGPDHLDPDSIPGFDREQGHPDPEPDLALLRSYGLGEESTVVDMGAGTGQFAVPAARHFGRVVAVEVSPAMARALRGRADGPDVPAPPECVEEGFLTYEHEGAPADAVFTRHALHRLPDFWKAVALRRVADLLRPGGVLLLRDLVYDFSPEEADTVFSSWLTAAAGSGAGCTSADLVEHLRTEHTTFSWLLEPMLREAGFDIAKKDFTGPTYGTYVCVKA